MFVQFFLDQVAPTFQRILFDKLISNFKSAGHENLVPIELKLTLTKVQHLLGEDHLVNSQVMIKGNLRVQNPAKSRNFPVGTIKCCKTLIIYGSNVVMPEIETNFNLDGLT